MPREVFGVEFQDRSYFQYPVMGSASNEATLRWQSRCPTKLVSAKPLSPRSALAVSVLVVVLLAVDESDPAPEDPEPVAPVLVDPSVPADPPLEDPGLVLTMSGDSVPLEPPSVDPETVLPVSPGSVPVAPESVEPEPVELEPPPLLVLIQQNDLLQ